MFSYAAKRIIRGRSLFLALFLSVALATTLFTGILHGADASSLAMLDKTLSLSDVDVVSGTENRNLTKTSFREVQDAIGGVEHVKNVDFVVRLFMDASNFTDTNATLQFTVVAISNRSSLLSGISGIGELGRGEVYLDKDSGNITRFETGSSVILKISTYNPYGTLVDFWPEYYNLTIGGLIDLDDRSFSIAMGKYPGFLRSILIGSVGSEQRAPHRLLIMNEDTLWDILNPIYAKNRRPSWVLVPEIIIGLDRSALLTPWDIQGSFNAVWLVNEEINTVGARYVYAPVNYLGTLLMSLGGYSASMKTTTILVAAPVFFTAWYLGVTVSDVSLGRRRREIGLLFTRGLRHRQVFYIFLFEAIMISLLAGFVGILLQAFILPLAMPGLNPLRVLGSMSPTTIAGSFAFSVALALLVTYKPARDATRVDIVEALTEHGGEEEGSRNSWQEPALALALGGYKVAMLLLGFSVNSFAPTGDNFLVTFLYNTWWGVDYILSYIAPILFFWGFTKLIIQHSSLFHRLMGRIVVAVVGDASIFSTLSSRRSAKRVVASTFMVALIFGYSILVIGGVEGTNDYMERTIKNSIGADASVWLFDNEGSKELAVKIAALDGVEGATVETWFNAQSSVGTIEVRIIDPLVWSRVAYIEPGWLIGNDAFQRMNGTNDIIIIDRGVVESLGSEMNGTMLIKMGVKMYSLTTAGTFGRKPYQSWTPLAPTIYIAEPFIDELREGDIKQTRILVKLKPGTSEEGFVKEVKALDPNVGTIDVTTENLRRISSNTLLMGPMEVEELGVYFAALASSLGVAIVVATTLNSRWKELTIMAIRGFSIRQLMATFLVENVSLVAFAMALGSIIGYVSLRGQMELYNSMIPSILERRVLFTAGAQLSIAVIAVLILAATITPILIAVKKASGKPVWSVEE